MQDVQNIPNPDINSNERDEDFGNHSAVDQDLDNEDVEKPTNEFPVPPDQDIGAPVEEPPKGEGVTDPKLIV